MRPIRTVPPKDEREYPLVITAEEKDKVLNYILVVANGKRTAKLNYKDIPDLRISKEQYEIVLEEFKNRRFIDYKGYGIEYLTLNFEIFNFAEKGGFTVERDLYISSNPQPIGFSGILLAKRQNSFYCTYFLHNRNVADTKSPYPIKRLEVIRWFNQKSMVFNQSLS